MVTMLSQLRELLNEKEVNFNSTYESFLYILGYMDGIKSQREFNWCSMTKEDMDVLIKESVNFKQKKD